MPQPPEEPAVDPVVAEIVPAEYAAAPVPPPIVAELEPPVVAETVATPVQRVTERRPRHWLATIASAAEWLFGVASMIAILSVLATIPILQMLSLGYLLEVSGRVARSDPLCARPTGVRTAEMMYTSFILVP